jgi:hypothetical protein
MTFFIYMPCKQLLWHKSTHQKATKCQSSSVLLALGSGKFTHDRIQKYPHKKKKWQKNIMCRIFILFYSFFGFLFLIPSRPAWSDGSAAFRLRRRSSKKAPSLQLSDFLTNEALRRRDSGAHDATYAIEEGSISPTFRISYERGASNRRAAEHTMLSTTPVAFIFVRLRSEITKTGHDWQKKTDHKFVQFLFVIIIVLGPLYTRSHGHVQPESSIPIGAKVEISPKGFTLGVRANVQPKSSIPIGANVEISPKGFTLGVRANVQPKSSIPIGAKVEISPKGFIH